jgi:hypothetical protein
LALQSSNISPNTYQQALIVERGLVSGDMKMTPNPVSN